MSDFAVVFAKCPRCARRTRLVVRGVVNGEVPVLYATWVGRFSAEEAATLVPAGESMVYEREPRMTPVKDAVPYLAWCRTCHVPLQGKPIRTYGSDQDCNDACEVATSATCRCKCGGFNHGVRS